VKRFLADLHIHTALSPCASEEMTPPAIVTESIGLGLHLIAICDHNSTGNISAVQKAAGNKIVVLAGIEITTAEEVHILGIFPDPLSASAVGKKVLATLPESTNASRGFGEQLLMDETGKVLATENKILSFASSFTLSQTVKLIKDYKGLVIASHIDRPSYSVLSQLGIFPNNAGFDAVEVSPAGLASSRAAIYSAPGLPIVTSSDSHDLTTIGTCYSMLEMKKPTFEELALTLKGIGERRIYNSA